MFNNFSPINRFEICVYGIILIFLLIDALKNKRWG